MSGNLCQTRAGRRPYRDVPNNTEPGGQGAHQQSLYPTDTTLCQQEEGTPHRAGGGIGRCPVPTGQQAMLPRTPGAAALGSGSWAFNFSLCCFVLLECSVRLSLSMKKGRKVALKKKGILTHATWMSLEDIMLSETADTSFS